MGLHNIILNVDNYKHCHYPLYPPGTEYVSSYIESRGGEFECTMFVGLQAFLREYLMHPITLEDIDEAEFITREQGMHFNRDNWLGILNDHGGFLPVEIEAVPEGTVLPSRNVLVQLINTDPKYFWATSFFETCLLRAVWYPTTIGTISWLSKQIIREALERTSDNPQILRHMLHDYGARGVSSQQSAALGGLAHLVNFSQSDTVPGILAAKRWYNAGKVSNSGPNSEHAAFCAWGREREADAMRNMLKVLPPYVRVVQGDGVTFYSLPKVFVEMQRRGLSCENAVFGMGGGLLQHHNRDTMNFGQKASAVRVNGEWRDIYKSPTGSAFKVSKKGRLALRAVNGTFETVPRDSIPPEENQLIPVFRNGKLLKKWDL